MLEGHPGALVFNSFVSSVPSQIITGHAWANANFVPRLLLSLVAYCLKDLSTVASTRGDADHRIEDGFLFDPITSGI